MAQIGIVLTEDHTIVRSGLRKILEDAHGIEVLAEATNGHDLLTKVRKGLRPDVVLMDIHMPHVSGVEATRQLRTILPDVAVVGLTAANDDETIANMIDAGACGYVLKDASPKDLIDKIRLAAANRIAMDAELLRRVSDYRRYASKQSFTPDNSYTVPSLGGSSSPKLNPNLGGAETDLTRRELEVMRQLMDGLSNKEIAQELVISERTVQTHLSNIFGKMEVNSRTEAVLIALRDGLVEEYA